MQVDQVFIGVDVAKAELVIAGSPGHAQLTIANSERAIRGWLGQLPKGAVIAMESTGRYSQLLARLSHAAGFLVFVLNAKDVWYYAKALGQRGKTDRLDSVVIRAYLREHLHKLHAWCPGTPIQQAVDSLLRRRAALVVHRDAVRKVMEDIAGLEEQASSLDKQFGELLRAIDAELQRLIACDPRLAGAQRRLLTITGIGPLSSALLAALFERIAFRNVDAFIAYSGLDPRPLDSGKKRGRRHLTKRGPALLRKLIFMAAFAASHSKAFGPVYDALRARGLSTTESMIILGRRLLRIAWAVWRTGEPFDANRVAGGSAGAGAAPQYKPSSGNTASGSDAGSLIHHAA